MSTIQFFRSVSLGMVLVMLWGLASLQMVEAKVPRPVATSLETKDKSYLRERRNVTVGGRIETWELRWESKPESVCGPEDISMSATCPCSGFSYGQRGRLVLVRKFHDQQIDRLELGSLFGEFDGPDIAAGDAFLVSRDLQLADLPRELRKDPTLLPDIRRRPIVQIMNMADYNRDGQATEFLLQVGTMPCGKHMMALVGVSKTNPKLHAFTSAEERSRPLVAGAWVWDALRRSPGRVEVIEWNCDDHGSEIESKIRLSARNGLIRAKREDLQCASAESDGDH